MSRCGRACVRAWRTYLSLSQTHCGTFVVTVLVSCSGVGRGGQVEVTTFGQGFLALGLSDFHGGFLATTTQIIRLHGTAVLVRILTPLWHFATTTVRHLVHWVVWCSGGVVWCGVVWCGVVWCGRGVVGARVGGKRNTGNVEERVRTAEGP